MSKNSTALVFLKAAMEEPAGCRPRGFQSQFVFNRSEGRESVREASKATSEDLIASGAPPKRVCKYSCLVWANESPAVSSVGHRVLSISSANSSGSRRDASGSRFWFEDFQSVQHARSQTIPSCKHQAVNAIEGHSLRRFAPEHVRRLFWHFPRPSRSPLQPQVRREFDSFTL